MNWFEKIAGQYPNAITFREEMTGYHHSQKDMILSAHDSVTGQKLGYIEYSEYGGEIHISMIRSEIKRQSIGTQLMQELVRRNPKTHINKGTMTPEGNQFFTHIEHMMPRRPEPEKPKILYYATPTSEQHEVIANGLLVNAQNAWDDQGNAVIELTEEERSPVFGLDVWAINAHDLELEVTQGTTLHSYIYLSHHDIHPDKLHLISSDGLPANN